MSLFSIIPHKDLGTGMKHLAFVQAVLFFMLLGAVTAQRTSYAVSFSQVRSDFHVGACALYINSKQATTVDITDHTGVTTENIIANTTFIKTYSPSIRVNDGVENKGILIEAEEEVSVMLASYRDDGHLETMYAPPLHIGPQEYTILSKSSVNDRTCATGVTCSFYSVVAYEDDTNINVYKLEDGQPNLLDTITLQRQNVYTNRTRNTEVRRNYDFTGYFITADKPVGVNSGNPCADTNPDESAGAVWASMVSDQFAGQGYISHTINYNGHYDDTLIRILALSDDTEVTSGGTTDTILYRGQYKDYLYQSNSNTVFRCNKPCKAAQFSRNIGDFTGLRSAVFMAHLVPTTYYTTDVNFNLPVTEDDTQTYRISIVYLTESPSAIPLYFDGVELTGWTIRTGEGFSTLEVEEPGAIQVAHSLSASGDKGFSALIHGQGGNARGYGFIAGMR